MQNIFVLKWSLLANAWTHFSLIFLYVNVLNNNVSLFGRLLLVAPSVPNIVGFEILNNKLYICESRWEQIVN